MQSSASQIFKVQATTDFLAPKADRDVLLSFRAGQAFYVLSADKDRGLYFVSTQYATPFSRTSVSGLVPSSHFETVDLLSRDHYSSYNKAKKLAKQKALAQQQKQEHQKLQQRQIEKENNVSNIKKDVSSLSDISNSSTTTSNSTSISHSATSKSTLLMSDSEIENVINGSTNPLGLMMGSDIIGIAQDKLIIKVNRKNFHYIIERTFDDFVILNDHLQRLALNLATHTSNLSNNNKTHSMTIDIIRAVLSMPKLQRNHMNIYLKALLELPFQFLYSPPAIHFFNPKNTAENKRIYNDKTAVTSTIHNESKSHIMHKSNSTNNMTVEKSALTHEDRMDIKSPATDIIERTKIMETSVNHNSKQIINRSSITRFEEDFVDSYVFRSPIDAI